jgi:hypothetical protein
MREEFQITETRINLKQMSLSISFKSTSRNRW